MLRLGTMLVFKEGTSHEDAERALLMIAHFVELGGEVLDYAKGTDDGKLIRRDKEPSDFIHEFNDRHGGPVWYLP